MKTEYAPIKISERPRSSAGTFIRTLSPEEDQERKRIRSRLKYQKNRLQILARQHKYYLKNKERIKETTKKYFASETGYAIYLRSHARYIQNNRCKVNARAAVSFALKSGKICKEPCIVCGSITSQAHHHDYYKPLDVIWLCREHHQDLHNVQISR